MGGLGLYNQNPFLGSTLLIGLFRVLYYFCCGRDDRRRGPPRSPLVLPLSSPNKSFQPQSRLLNCGYLLWYLMWVSATLTIWFEYYYYFHKCAVSTRYSTENLALAARVYAILDDNHYCFWLDYATLLAQQRGQTLNAWEHDADFSILHPDYYHHDAFHASSKNTIARKKSSSNIDHKDYSFKYCPRSSEDIQLKQTSSETRNPGAEIPPGVAEVIELFTLEGYETHWTHGRNLLQIGPPHAPHVDLWFYIPEFPEDLTTNNNPTMNSIKNKTNDASSERNNTTREEDDRVVLWTGDQDTHYNPRRYSDIFPLNRDNEGWANIHNVPLPNRAAVVSQTEYASYGGDYMTPVVTRGDCFHNLFQGRIFY